MTEFLGAEPQVDGDATFRNFQRHNLGRAAEHFGVALTAAPSFGWRLRSIGAPVNSEGSTRWLRVVSEEPRWATGHAWTGNVDANVINDLRKPRVLGVLEWPERDWRHQRAELMTLLDGATCSRSDVLHEPLDVPPGWWAGLGLALGRLAEIPTDRLHAGQDRVASRIRDRFGDGVDATVTRWATAHGDLHWANLMGPDVGVLDWELWGMAPAGTDAATLICYSLLEPSTAAQVHRMFGDVLDTPTGRVAQLYVVARLLRRIDGGDHPELAGPLRSHAAHLIGQDGGGRESRGRRGPPGGG